MRKLVSVAVVVAWGLAACSGDKGAGPPVTSPGGAATDSVAPPVSDPPPVATTVPAGAVLLAGAASNSILPTVGDERAYLDEAPGWTAVDPIDIGVFVPTFDQGRVDVGNGNEDGS